MTMLASVILTGHSGRSYPFTVILIGSTLAATGGVYAVLRDGPVESFWMSRTLARMDHPPRMSHSDWTVLYIGQTEGFRARFANAQLDLDLARIRATHLAILEADAEPERRVIEVDLAPRYASLLIRPPRSPRKTLVESITIAHRSA